MGRTNIIMTNSVLNFLALALYLSAGGLLWQRLARGQAALAGAKIGILALGLGAVVLHAAILYVGLRLDTGLNFALTGVFSLVAWAVAVLFLLAALTRPVENLGILILPLAGLTILIEWLWPGEVLLPESSPRQAAHIVISLLAYSLLCLASVQGLLLMWQERELRQKHPGGFIRALPPMQTMETLMFQMIGVGFVLLTLTLISGIFFSEEVFGRPLKLTHHIVLSLVAWGVFATLLAGRQLYGWRGRTAIRLTLTGFTLLVLGYFGTKFVLEILLQR
jgi:ABC-type uncharacterized transport system permease subunit